jgi:hypothetical protein
MNLAITRLRKILDVAAILLVFGVIAEGAGRVYWHHHLLRRHMRYGCSTMDGPLYMLDPQAGYSYVPDAKLHLTLYDEEYRPLRTNNVIVNNFGHLSLDNDSMQKPPSEFRVAVIGDSFSATTPSDITWPTLLQRDLNEDQALKKAIGKASFKVINFGLDGTGFVQWPNVYKYKVQPFHPDVVIVNFIGTDIDRRFFYRNTITIGDHDQAVITCTSLPAKLSNPDCASAYLFVLKPGSSDPRSEIARFKNEMQRKLVARLPWFSLYPQMLGVLLNGRFGLHSRLELNSGGTPLFESSQKAIAASRKALETIASAQHRLIVLYHPVLQECLAKQAPPDVREFMAEENDLNIENMLNFLPLKSSPNEIRSWYNSPYDQHPSDYGAGIYARVVEGTISELLVPNKGSQPVAAPSF